MHVTEIYPHEAWRPKRPVWRTRRGTYSGEIGQMVSTTKDGGDPKKGGRFSRVVRHVARDRALFYRFTTTPNWAGIKAALAGAAQVMRGHGK